VNKETLPNTLNPYARKLLEIGFKNGLSNVFVKFRRLRRSGRGWRRPRRNGRP
jgi:hypothetical protein